MGIPGEEAIVFLHGLMGGAGDWREIGAQFAGGAYCLLVDLPGHGASDPDLAPEDHGFAATARIG